nr:M20/M25/M40 family metallo-hydrolase [Thermoanaerobaculia bacterium]
ATMLALKRSGKPLSRSVIFLATGTEEVGSDLGTRWVLAQHPEIGKRAWGFLTEGGVVETRAANEVKYWGIEFVQKHFVDVTVCGPSQEQLEGLRTELLEERDQLSPETSFQATSTPELEAFLTHYGPTRDSERLRAILARPRQLHLDGVAYSELPPYLRAFFRDEAIPFPVKEIAAGDYSMLIKMHLLPGADTEEVLARLLPPWKRAGLSVAVHDEHSADHGSPLDHPIYRSLEEELQKAFPDRPVGPQFLPYTATDSRWVRAAGIPAYGFSPFLVFSSETFRIGLPNERISLPAFLKGCEIYLRAVQQLVG